MRHRHGPTVVSSRDVTYVCPVIWSGCLMTECIDEMFFETSTRFVTLFLNKGYINHLTGELVGTMLSISRMIDTFPREQQ